MWSSGYWYLDFNIICRCIGLYWVLPRLIKLALSSFFSLKDCSLQSTNKFQTMNIFSSESWSCLFRYCSLSICRKLRFSSTGWYWNFNFTSSIFLTIQFFLWFFLRSFLLMLGVNIKQSFLDDYLMSWLNMAQEGLVEIREDYVEENSCEGELKTGMLLLSVDLHSWTKW